MSESSWYRTEPQALTAAVAEAAAVQPLMQVCDEGNRVVLRGRFDVRTAAGTVVEAFEVDVQLPAKSPRHLPTVWETGGRIPRVLDPHHVVPETENLCVILPEAYWFYYPKGLTLAEFLEGPLRSHLAGQSVVLRGESWPAGEWSHGVDGVMEFYHEILGTSDTGTVGEMLRVASHPGMKGHWTCPCGSGKKLRKCHGETLWALRRAPTFEVMREVFHSDRRKGTSRV